eukprot:gene162-20724_t
MGYNSWYDLECSAAMDESTLRATADKMVELGLPKLGYKYLNLDDCYVHSRLPNGTLVPDPVKFPSGMRALADYIHSKGLLFGVYTARCRETCAGRPASLDNEAADAHTFAILWDADYSKRTRACGEAAPGCGRPVYTRVATCLPATLTHTSPPRLKEDSCRDCSGAAAPIELYAKMRDALNHTGKRVLFDMCRDDPPPRRARRRARKAGSARGDPRSEVRSRGLRWRAAG